MFVTGLQNDHKMVMKHIEEKLHEVHAQAREERVVHQIGELSTDGNHTVHNNGSSIPRIPFAKITLVDGGSPAESAVCAEITFLLSKLFKSYFAPVQNISC